MASSSRTSVARKSPLSLPIRECPIRSRPPSNRTEYFDMRKLLFAIALAAAPLSACATLHTVDQAVALANQNVGDFTVLDEKSWYYAEALYNVPASAYLSANSRGLI